MTGGDRLLGRLAAIGSSLAASDGAPALLALGSAGVETERMDEFSDLDFFVVVAEGAKGGFLADLAWLGRVGPIAYSYRNTPDGHKALLADGVFCEFAVFEAGELTGIPFAAGRVAWRREGFDADVCTPTRLPAATRPDADWLLGEALSGLYTGLGRGRRGETLAAFRAIQVEAAGRAMELARAFEPNAPGGDPFAPERRFERRYPALAPRLPSFMQGYGANIASALAILTFLEGRFEVNAAMAAAIRTLASGPALAR